MPLDAASTGLTLTPERAEDAASTGLTLAPERAEDVAALEALFDAAFGPGRFAKTSYRVRDVTTPAPELSILAWDGSQLLGAARQHRGRIGEARGAFLGPFGVTQAARSRGLGARLIEAAVEAAQAAGLDFVMLIGTQSYFAPLGFEPVAQGSVILPGPVDPARLLIRRLTAVDAPAGRLEGDTQG